MKKLSAFVLFMLMSTAFLPAPALADRDGYGAKQCAMGHKDCDGRDCGGRDGSQCPIASKVLKKAGFFLKNQKEIGLSDEQVAQIRAIKMETKKADVRAGAEMEIFELELNEKLAEPKVDVEGLNAMMDQAMAGWGAGAKTSIANYAKLKAVLNETQMAKAKELWSKDDKK